MHTIACLVITNPKAFSWLGHMPVVNWTRDKLADVRGVDAVVTVASKDLVAQTSRLLAADDIKVIPIPDNCKNIDQWLCSAEGPAAEADIVLRVRPTAPFLPAATIEECLNRVRRQKCQICVPARRLDRYTIAVDSMRVFIPTSIHTSEPNGYDTVPVNSIEALDVTEPEDSTLADALVRVGRA